MKKQMKQRLMWLIYDIWIGYNNLWSTHMPTIIIVCFLQNLVWFENIETVQN